MNEVGSGSADRSRLIGGKFVFILPNPTIKMKEIQTKTINIQAIKKFGCLAKL